MYIDCVINKENVALLFHIALKIKSVKEAQSARISLEERKKLVEDKRLDEDPDAVSLP